MSRPSHEAFIVQEPKEGSDRKSVWHRVGALWPAKNGNGWTLLIPDGISVSGRVIIVERKDDEQQ